VATCTTDEDCEANEICVNGECQPEGGDYGPIPCTDDGDCPQGWVCVGGYCEQLDGGPSDGDGMPEPDIEILAPPPTAGSYILDFGSVLVGHSTSGTVRFKNVGDADLRITNLSFEMGTVADFSLDQAVLDSLPIILAPDEESEFDVLYTASDGINDYGVLNIVSNDPDEALVHIQLESTFKGTAAISIDPVSLDFGDVPVGETGTRRLAVSNAGTGNAVLTLQAIRLEIIGNANYALTGVPSFPAYLNTGDSLDISVVFHPTSVATHADRVQIFSSDTVRPRVDVPVTGRGVTADLIVTPAPVDFGAVRVGATDSMTVTLENAGGADLSITGITLSPAMQEFVLTSDPATGFDLANLSAANPQVLTPAETRDVTIDYTPTDTVSDSVTLQIESPDITPSPRQVSVTGTGVIPPSIGVTPASLDFGDVQVRDNSTLPVTVRNNGEGFLTVGTISILNDTLGNFQYSPSTLPNLGPGDESVLSVTFAPSVIGFRESTLQLSSNDPDTPNVTVQLSGNGTDPSLRVQPLAPVDLGDVYPGQFSTVTITIQNFGIGDLEISNIALMAGSSPDFSLVNLPALPAILADSTELLTFQVRYDPDAEGTDAGALRIDSSDIDDPIHIHDLMGEGVGCPVGQWDVNGDPSDGCEYSCVRTNNGVEACDGIDNDCDAGDCGGSPCAAGIDEDYDLTSDPLHCGVCYNSCDLYNNATGVCVSSICEMGPCDANFHDINGNDQDGCEYNCPITNGGVEACDTLDNDCDGLTDEDFDLTTDVNNCGVCGNVCSLANAVPECVGSVCVIQSCTGDFENCDAQNFNGCEVNLMTNPDNCLTCGNVCIFGADPGVCVGGACFPGDCSTGFLDCDGLPGPPQCEVNPNTDENNCGSCGNVCDPGEFCETGVCRCGSTGPDCTASQTCCGVECVDIQTDNDHCGACNVQCDPNEICTSGSCSCGGTGPDCNPLLNEICCDQNCFNSQTSVLHCGDCGTQCDLNEQCINGSCDCGGSGIDCWAPDVCCGTQCVDLNVNTSNCGGCGIVCNDEIPHAFTLCVTGSCVLDGCRAGWADCNSNPADGCEIDINTDLSNCGACGTVCTNAHGSTVCTSGNCVPTCVGLWGNCNSDPVDGCETALDTLTNCGACFASCSMPNATATCATGTCEIASCNAGYADCTSAAGCETHIDSNVNNCGACGNVCTNAHGTTQCNAGVCNPTCSSLWGNCDGDPDDGCETTLTTLVNCGACGVACNLPNATESCATGTCLISSCDSGYFDCNINPIDGCEINLNSDVNNCGSCGNQCMNPHGTTQCVAGTCTPSCTSLWGDCNSDPDDGCETPLNTLANCGACGVSCDLPGSSNETCATGTCQVGTCDSGWADCNGNPVDGCEVNLNTSVNNCGSCGNQCTNAHGSATCTSGVCTPTCNPLWGDCDGDPDDGCETPLNTLTDCGSCGTGCSLPNANESCTTGTCVIASCNSGYADCNSTAADGCEINTNTNVNNCGSCGTVCNLANATATCTSGSCQIASCNSGYEDCNSSPGDGCEINTNTNVNNCGGCGTVCNLPNSVESCTAGTCEIASCNSGYADCNSLPADGCEINTNTNVNNCGGCGTVCNLPNATEVCSGGTCQIGSCSSGYRDCNSTAADGCEININTNINNCGSCGNQCTNDHGGTACISGLCTPTCVGLWGNCDGDADDGCETQLDTLTNCGGCGITCNLPNASETCATGTCEIVSCNLGYADCNSTAADGCEINTNTNINNCGSCGTQCINDHGSTVCTSGICVPTCVGLWGNCNSNPVDGCETALTTLTDCGACGVPCDLPGSGETCVTGTCEVSSCNPGYADCNGNPGDGCEINTNTDVNNCGACGVVCNLPNATEVCVSGTCQIASCSSGYQDCNSLPADGCEINTNSDVNNCGGCGTVCNLPNASETCSGGTCQIASCNAGYENCNSLPADGCEININTNVNNCGSCGNVCNLPNANEICSAGTCQVGTCSSGYEDCNGLPADGCEINTNTNVNNCGGCGNVCDLPNANESCIGGTCLISSCNTGYRDCNSTAADGCEVNINIDVNNCGGCGAVCNLPNANETCTSGTCQIASCNTGYRNCNGLAADGCEININTDVNNCGACGTVCNLPNASESCIGGTCQIASCNAGYRDCNTNPADGCEININADINNCGSCGNVCNLPNANETCLSGTCQISSCNTGYRDCNTSPADGCEVNINTDVSNCGSCGNVCTNNHGTTQCTNGDCDPTCIGLWGDCDGDPDDGCETAVNTLTNCGSCGVTCSQPNATPTCATGTCQIESCNPGYMNCTAAPGCETDIYYDENNCGGCSVLCDLYGASEQCVLGICDMTNCNPNYYDVDAVESTGCECYESTDALEDCSSVVGGAAVATINVTTPSAFVEGVIIHRTGIGGRIDRDCYKVVYEDSSPAGGRFHVYFDPDPGTLALNVFRNDCATVVCDTGVDSEFESVCSSLGGTCQTHNNNTFIVCVHARTGLDNLCQGGLVSQNKYKLMFVRE